MPGEDVLTGVAPVTIVVEIYPGAQVARRVGRHHHGRRRADVKRGGEGHAILVIVARSAGTVDQAADVSIVVGSAGRGLTVRLRVHAVAEIDIAAKPVLCAVVRQRRRVGVRRIAEIVGVLDLHFVILNLTIVSITRVVNHAVGSAAEAGEGLTLRQP